MEILASCVGEIPLSRSTTALRPRSGHSTITCFARLLTRVTTRDYCSHEVRLDRDVTVRRRGQCGCGPVRLHQSAKPKPRANPNIRASAFNGRLNLSMTLDQIYNHFGRDDVRDRFFEGQHPVPSWLHLTDQTYDGARAETVPVTWVWRQGVTGFWPANPRPAGRWCAG